MLTYLPYETETLTETLACCRAAAEIGISCNTVHLLQHAPRLTSCAPIEFDPFLPFLTFLNFVSFIFVHFSTRCCAHSYIIHCFFVGIQCIWDTKFRVFFNIVETMRYVEWHMGCFKFGIRVFCLQYFFDTVCCVIWYWLYITNGSYALFYRVILF